MGTKRDEVVKALEVLIAERNFCTNQKYVEACGLFCSARRVMVSDLAKSNHNECTKDCEHYSPPHIYCVLKDALSLINELTKDNERLRAERDTRDIAIKDLYSRNKELQSANEDLGNHCLDLENELQECVDIKTKALNEFTLRLAKAVGTYTKESYVYVHAWFTLVNKIIEDMIGETK